MASELRFDLAVFSIDAIKAACYRFSDKCSPAIEVQERTIVCQLQFDSKLSDASIVSEIENFRKEVLDQELRQKLKAETEPIRNLILAHAFSKTGLIADE